jgi:hypothetical protein
MQRMMRYLSNYDAPPREDVDEGTPIQENRSVPEHPEQVPASGWGELEDDGTEPLMVFHPHHGGIVDLKHRQPARAGANGGPHARQELISYFTNFWNGSFRSNEYNIIEKFLMVCELPATILRMVGTDL